MVINVNWDDVSDDFGFELPATGKYKALIINAEEKYSENAGDYIGIEIQIQEPERYMKCRIFDNLMFHNKTCLERSKKIFNIIGLGHLLKKGVPSTNQICRANSFCVNIIHEEYQGDERAKPHFFKGYYPLEKLEEKENISIANAPDPDSFGDPPF